MSKEAGVLRACLDLLAAHNIWHRRWNTGAVKVGKRFFRFGRPGDADILAMPRIGIAEAFAIYGPWPLWIECKSQRGDQTAEQVLFQEEVRDQGHYYLLVRDANELVNWLKEHGAI